MTNSEQGELSLLLPDPEATPVASDPAQAALACKGIRSTRDFPAALSALSREQIEHHYQAMRNSHASLTRSRAQLQRRSREFTVARERFLETLRSYEGRLMALGQEKAEALRIAQDMHRELEAFVASLRGGPSPVVDGRVGLKALDVALRVKACIDDG